MTSWSPNVIENRWIANLPQFCGLQTPQPARDPEREIRAAAALQRREQNGRIVNNRFYREDRGEGGRSRSPRSPLRPAAEGRLNLRQRRESRHTAASLGGRAPSLSPMSQDIPLVIDVPDDRHRRQSWEEDFWQRQPAHESRFVNVHRNEGLLNLITIDQTRSEMCAICHERYSDDVNEREICMTDCQHDFHQFHPRLVSIIPDRKLPNHTRQVPSQPVRCPVCSILQLPDILDTGETAEHRSRESTQLPCCCMLLN